MNQSQHQHQQYSATGRQQPSAAPEGSPASGLNPYSAGSSSSAQADELHMGGPSPQDQVMTSPRIDYAPSIKLDTSSSVPNILQPGGRSGRPQPVSSNTAPNAPTLQGGSSMQTSSSAQSQHSSSSSLQQPSHTSPHDFQSTPSKPPSFSMTHQYSAPSPGGGGTPYDNTSNYYPYTPTTPGGGPAPSSQFMSPTDYGPGSQRNISNTPLGLADIRPRADSSMSDGHAGPMGYDVSNVQPGTSNYLAPWAIYAFDWCKWAPQGNGAGKLAVGSYLEDGHNFIQILDSHMAPTPQDVYAPGTSKYSMEFTKVAEATHSYPVTRLLWEPPSSQKQSTDLLATSGDHLRLWSLPSETPVNIGNTIGRGRDAPINKLTPLALLSNSKTPDHTAPLTSLDWNTVSPSLIITSSIDTTCTIWDIPSLTAKTQLIAHDKEVYDVRFCANSVDVFVSCGQDGSVRMFDLRSLEHSTIIYEPTGKDDKDNGRTSPTTAQQTMSNPPPLLRLATSPHDTHLLATFAQDSNTIRILDVRQPGQALLELRGHAASINCLDWSPLRRGMLASGGDDCQVLLWDLLNQGPSGSGNTTNGGQGQESHRSPVASWECEYEIGNLGWVPHLQNADYGEWLGVSAGRGIWGTRVG